MLKMIPILILSACHGVDYELQPEEEDYFPWQGDPLPLDDQYKTDHIIADNVSPITLLVVIDNSVSMQDEQSRLKSSVPKLLDYLIDSGRDFHFGTTSSDCDMNCETDWGCDPSPCGIVDWMEGGPSINRGLMEQQVINLVDVGIQGSSIEKILQPIHAALAKRYKENLGFFYDYGPVHMLTITDEIDQTDTEIEEEPKREDDVLVEMIELERERKVFSYNSIVRTTPNEGPVFFPPRVHGCDAYYDSELVVLPAMFSGALGNICDDDWDPIIEEVAKNFVKRPKTFYLSEKPVVDTIEVGVVNDGFTIFPEDHVWLYEEFKNAITFNDLFPEEYLDEVIIDYQVR